MVLARSQRWDDDSQEDDSNPLEDGSAKREYQDSHGHEDKRAKLSCSDGEGETGMVNLSSAEGQLESYPNVSTEQTKLLAKREYNRKNAARVRIRNKQMLHELQDKVAFLTKRTGDLERENEVLSAQIKILSAQQQHQRAAVASNPALATSLTHPMMRPQQQGIFGPTPPSRPTCSTTVVSTQTDQIRSLLTATAQFSAGHSQPQNMQQPGVPYQLKNMLSQLLQKPTTACPSHDNSGMDGLPQRATRAETNASLGTAAAPTAGQESSQNILAEQQQKEEQQLHGVPRSTGASTIGHGQYSQLQRWQSSSNGRDGNHNDNEQLHDEAKSKNPSTKATSSMPMPPTRSGVRQEP